MNIEYVMYAYGLHLFYLATKNLHLVTILYHLVAKWQLKDFFFYFKPWVILNLSLAVLGIAAKILITNYSFALLTRNLFYKL